MRKPKRSRLNVTQWVAWGALAADPPSTEIFVAVNKELRKHDATIEPFFADSWIIYHPRSLEAIAGSEGSFQDACRYCVKKFGKVTRYHTCRGNAGV